MNTPVVDEQALDREPRAMPCLGWHGHQEVLEEEAVVCYSYLKLKA